MSNENEGEKAESVVAPPNPASASYLRDQAAKMLEEASRIDRLVAAEELRRREERKPKCPQVDDGDYAVVIFTKYQAGREYRYAAVGWRVGRALRWTVTGQNTERMNWPALLQFVGEANWPSLHQVTNTVRIGPEPDDEAPVSEVIGAYGRVLGSYSPGGVVDPLVRAEVPTVHGGAGGGGRGGFAAGGLVFGPGSPFGRGREGGY
ncbi:hypothetical protein SEA_RAWRGERTHAT_88 [Mycobacterium phage RawrgerThat]|nr:hypothetical protein SEA_RAWRGERTHAT_88 [Mycobacterium phage RawrgerThat]